MKWLEGRLHDWNEAEDDEDKIHVVTAWFYPWKYRSQEEVWRSLVAEVIIACLSETTDKAAKSDIADFGRRERHAEPPANRTGSDANNKNGLDVGPPAHARR
jgi:hypothetical protein